MSSSRRNASSQMPVLFQQVARIAKRGRKRWLGLVFVTQLPQHLPDEVLGLINNFILHKIADGTVVDRLRKSISGIDQRAVGHATGAGSRPGTGIPDPHDAPAAGLRRSSAMQTQALGVSPCWPPIAPTDLIPVRALNQVTYCPRLYWLQYVEGLMVINEHVEDGVVKHGRVNDPRLPSGRAKSAIPSTRAASPWPPSALGLTGKLDLIEEKEGEVYPVEYKRSAAPTDANGQATYWDNDAVQLCAQGLLLEEHLGQQVPSAFLYYIGSKTPGQGAIG